MKVTFLGGADEVGASSTLLDIGGTRILVDAGIRISPRSSRGIANSQLPDLQLISEAGGPDFILVTHAHTDHTGALPMVVEQYPNVPVIMTRPTFALTQVLQKDAQRIMKSRHDEEGELPLFDEISVNRLMEAVQLVEFNQPVKLGDSIQVTYYVSGHIAGAALLVIESSQGTLVMSGDVSKSPQRTVKSIEVPRLKADALVLESTYGGRLHANRHSEEIRLMDTLKRVTERGGKVLIPAFALGRAQEVVQIILAYRDQLDCPVFVDGMVRSVCDAYNAFADLLPKETVRAAGTEHLFFRQEIRGIRNLQHRSDVAMREEPCVVVASSGMLTGGASVFYASHFVGDERNAILLTGYQDEEAPGRFLQRIMREKDQGETPTLNLAGKQVSVRCEIDTYSLSAHADESELVAIAQALKPSEVMLVHGDSGARHSLATALRQREIKVTTPRVGTVREFDFGEKPWAIGAQVSSGSQTGAVDLQALWESLKTQAGSIFSTRELAQIWWGNGERANEILTLLESDTNLYFSQHWRNKNAFAVKSEQQVQRTQLQRAIMLANPDIVGKLVVLRNSNEQPRLGVVRDADIDSFTAEVANAKGSQYPADALLWAIGPWENTGEGSTKKQLSDLLKAAKSYVDVLLPFDKRQALVNADQAVNPVDLLPAQLPENVTSQMALVSIILGLADDHAVLEQGGLRPQRARQHGPLEQNEARDLVMNSLPKEARLRKVGMDVPRQRLTLTFDFPQQAKSQFADEIDQLIDQTGWQIEVKQTTNQQALAGALSELLPDAATITKGPSIYTASGEVGAKISGLEDADALKKAYLQLTGFRLVLEDDNSENAPTGTVANAPKSGVQQMEINAAYGLIRAMLDTNALQKTSLKQGQIVLTFISPQVGQRYAEQLEKLSEQIGYGLAIHPHPNQQQILLAARQLAQNAGWDIRKGPGIHTDRALVSVTLATMPEAAEIEKVQAELEQQTGYRFEVAAAQ
ncbi:MAG: MBL fold metallo-hydrolase [Anaerolineaceae bacterium]|nr:MBL fold metallo-hydrolase [Anaerolineaceae bacterium]